MNYSIAWDDFTENEENIEKLSKESDFISLEYIKCLYTLKINDLELSKVFWLSFCILFMFKYEKTKKYGELFDKIDKDVVKLSLKLYYFEFDLNKIQNNFQIYNKIKNYLSFLVLDDKNTFDNNLFNFILSNTNFNFDEMGKKIVFPDKAKRIKKEEIIRISEFKTILKYLSKISIKNCFLIIGEEGFGKTFLVKTIINEINGCVMIVDLYYILKEKNYDYLLLKIFRESIILKAFICFKNLQILNLKENFLKISIFSELIQKYNENNLFFLSNEKIKFVFNDIFIVEIELKKLSIEQSKKIWQKVLDKTNLSSKISTNEISSIFDFSPKQINLSYLRLKNLSFLDNINKKKIIHCIKNVMYCNIDKYASKINIKYNWKDLIIKNDELEILKEACNRVKYKSFVFDTWGLENKIHYGAKGLTILISGQSGTGKTMAASVFANELGLDIYRVDISQVVSKYIGETQKNLCKIFLEAKKINTVLLFDEVDAILGKRCETKDSHDRNANMEISYLLQKMEEYEGICIMTTNFLENIDKAFFRRISYVVHFSLPGIEQRKKIWEYFLKNIPSGEKLDFDFISKFEFSGGSIKNAAISATFLAASDGEDFDKNSVSCRGENDKKHYNNHKKICMKHVLKSIKYELEKQGHCVISNEFGKYSHLMK